MGTILFILGGCMCFLFWVSTWEIPESQTEAEVAAAEKAGRPKKEPVTFGDFVFSVIQIPLILMLMVAPFYFIFKLIF